MTVERRVGDWISTRYEIYDIHYGGMGVVYIVYDHAGVVGQRVLALKTLRDIFLNDRKQIARFIEECKTWIKLERHPNVVRAYSVQEMEGKPHAVLELVTGGDLRRWIGTPRLDLPQALRFAVQLCLGMEHAVQKGLTCHRDIKPENLLITEGGTLKITDFGLAKVRDEALAAARVDIEPIPVVELADSPQEIKIQSSGLGPSGSAVDSVEAGLRMNSLKDPASTPPAPPPENLFDGFEVDNEVDKAQSDQSLVHDTRPDIDLLDEQATVDESDMSPPQDAFCDVPTLDEPGLEPEDAHGSENPTVDWGGGDANQTRPDPPDRSLIPSADKTGRFGAMSSQRRQEITDPNAILGTMAYMSPEQSLDAKSVDIRADIYSFGIVLYEMIMRERPFKADSVQKLRSQHAKAIPPSVVGAIPRRYGKVAKRVDHIIHRCLEKDPSKRYATFFELRQDLAVALRKLTGEKLQAPTPAELEAWELTSKGVSLGTLGRFQEERESYEDSFLVKPDYVPAWFNQAAALGSLSKWAEAVEYADVALLLNPASVPALINKALALHALKKPEEAMKHFDAAVHIQPRDPEVWYGRAIVLLGMANFEGAKSALDQALRLMPTFVEAHEALYAASEHRVPWNESQPMPRSRFGAKRAGPNSWVTWIPWVRRTEDTQPESIPK